MALRKVGPQGNASVKTYVADAVIPLGTIVKVGAADANCAPITVAGTRGIGICAAGALAAGNAAGVTRHGDVVAIAGSAASAGQYAASDAAGRPIPATGAAGSGQEIVGRFESSPTVLGDECVIFVCPFIL